jgi:tetratricopeptide (TPR) repeat protein
MTDIQAQLELLAQQPGDAGALSAVAAAYSAEGRWEELLRVYEDSALRAEPARVPELLRHAASLCIEQLASAPRAEVYLARAIEVAPADLESHRALREIYMSRGDWERGVAVYEKELARTADPRSKAAGLVQVAEIFREKLHREDKALSALRQAQRSDKSFARVYQAMAAIYELQGRLDQAQSALLTELEVGGAQEDILARLAALAQRMLDRPRLHELAAAAVAAICEHRPADERALAIQEQLQSFQSDWRSRVAQLQQDATEAQKNDSDRAADAWLAVAELQLVYGNDADSALLSLDKAAAAEPGHSGALRLMEKVYGGQDRYEDLGLKLEMMAAHAREPAVAVDLYVKAAVLQTVRLDNPDASAGIHQRVLQLDPSNKVSSNALAEYFRERNQWDDALAVLGTWAERATNAADKVAAHYACTRILDEELGDRTRARPHHEAILDLDPANQAAARALEVVYRQAGDQEALARALQAKLAGAKGEERVGILRELGDLLAGPLARPADALEALGELYQMQPDASLRERLEELGSIAGAFAELVQILEAGLDRIDDNVDKIQAMHSLAALYESARDAPLDALRMHRLILAMDPEDARARGSLGRLMAAAAESGDKVAFFREQADAAGSATEKVDTLTRLATELVDNARDYVRAIDVYREILKLDPDHADAREALLGLYRRDNRWAEVAEVLLAKVERMPEEGSRAPVQVELGQIMEERLGDVDRAADWYMAALASHPENADAVAGLERLLSRAKRVITIAELLQPRYLAAENWPRAAAMIEIRVKAAEEPQLRAELLRSIAGIYEQKLGTPAEACNALLRAFQADPTDAGLQVELERLAARVEDFSGVVRVYRASTSILDGERRTRMQLRAASFAEKNNDLAGAATDFLKVLGLAEITDQTAMEGLRRLVGAGHEPTKIIEAAKQVGASLEEPQRAAYWRKLARLYEQDMNDPTAAITAWREVLNSHDSDPEATAELDRLYASGGEPAELIIHLRAKLGAAHDDTSRAALGGQLAEVMADKMDDLDGAIAELNRVAELAPGQRLVWQRLCDMHTRKGDPQAAAQAMHKELGLLPEGEERRERLVLYAEVVGKQLGDLSTALQALKSVVAGDARSEPVARLLEEYRTVATDPDMQATIVEMLQSCYVALERWPEALAALAARVDASNEAAERVELLQTSAGIKADKTGDAAGAYADLERAFHDAPLDAELRDKLERAAEACLAWEQLAGALQAALAATGDPEAQKPLRRKLAEVLDSRLGRGAEAIDQMRAATGGELPEDPAELEALERLLREQNRPDELADVLYALVARLPAEQAERKQTLLLELAQLCQSTLLDKHRAVESYRALLEIDVRDERALRPLEELLAELDRPEERAEILSRLVAKGTQNASLVDDLVKLAAVQAQLGNHEEAVKHYRAILLKRREHAEAIEGLESLLSASESKLEIAQILEPIYTAKQDHAKLALVLAARLDATEDRVQRKGLLRRIGDIYENRLGQKERAFAMARRSLHEDPSDMGVRMWIEKLSGETGALAELADAYVEEAEGADPQLALQFHRRAAAIYHEKMNDFAWAVREYNAILKIEARDEKALTGLENIHRAQESWADLIALLRRRLELTAGLERKREYLAEIAGLEAEKVGDAAAAVSTYEEILDLTPDDTAAFGSIEQLLAQLGRWDQLAALYEGEVDRLAEKRGRDVVARRLEYQYRRGRVLDEHFGERAQAAEIFEGILAESPAHGSTLQYLEARAEQGILEAIEILEGVYQRDGAWKKYVQLLEVKLDNTAESEQRKPIYVALAEAYDEQLKVGDMAFRALARAHQENRTDIEVIERLEELAGRYGAWQNLVAVLGVEIDTIPDPSVRQHLLRRIGTITGEYFGDVQRAVQYFQAALQYDPNDDESLAALDSLLEKNQMWAALADLLERRIDLATEPGVKSKLLERLAEVWADRLMDAEAALRCHQQILEIDPDHPISLRSMQKLYVEVQDWDALARNLTRQSEVLTDRDEQIRIHAAAGELYAEELSDYDGAISHWQSVVELQPTHEEGNQALDVLLTAEERWEELADHYRRQLTHTQDPTEKSEINQRLGVILGEKLGRTDDALTSWLEVLRSDDKNLDALRALLQLYSERAMWEEFVAVARRIIPLTDPGEAKEVRFLLAKALGENLGQRDEAIKLAREVRATEPHTADQLTRLAEMLKTIEAFDEAVIALEKGAALEEDTDVKVALYYEAAEIHAEKLGKPNDARAAFEAIRAATPDDEAAFTSLAEVYRNTEEWRKLVSLDEDFVPWADADNRLRILTEIRNVQDEKLNEKELAFIAACRVLKEAPGDQGAAEVLERLGIETDGAEEAVAVLEDELDNIVDPGAKIATYRRVARIYAEELKDTPAAEAALNQILEIEPSDLQAIERLAVLGAEEDRFDKQIAALETKLQYVGEEGQRKGVLFEIARIWEDQIGEVDEAIGALQRVLEIDGGDKNALDALVRLYEQEARWSELAHTLTRKVELSQDVEENVALRMRVAGLCEAELEDDEAAVQWYRGVLEFEPGHAGALSSLERLYTGHEAWSELIQTYEVQLVNTQAAEEQIAILAKMASIYEEEFESNKDAAACFERIFAIDSTSMSGIKNLERLLRALGEWHRLIEVLEHHITQVSEAEEITDLYLQIGEIYYRELAQVDKAEQVYNAARDFNPNSAAALHALGQLYERSGNWFQSLEMLQKEADAVGVSPEALSVLLRIGKINEDMLMDMGAAQTAYQRALGIDPNYGPALQAMKEIARAAEDWDAYAEHLIAEAETAVDAEDKTELFSEAARFYADVREDEQSAIRYFQRALEITPSHIEAARALAEIYFRNEMWEEAGELYEVAVSRLDKAESPKDYCQKNYRLGYISEKLGESETALAYYREAFEADATYLPALEGLGQALLAAEEWEEAQRVFGTILVHHRDSLTESEIVDVQWQLGDICLQQEQPDRAYKQYEKALEIDPDHGPSLAALARLDQEMENWEGAYERLSRLADAVAGRERGGVLLQLSDIARNKLSDIRRSVAALERARRMGEPPVEVLEQLADAYLETHQPQKAVEVLEQAVAAAPEPETHSELCFKLGRVYQTEIKHEPMAVQKYNEALDASPKNVKAFEAIEQVLSMRQEWGLLEQNYRAMVARAKDLGPQIRLVLWRNLGELYRRVLKSLDNAIMAYEVIQKLEPGRPEDAAILADLYAQKPEHRAKAIEMAHAALATSENPVEPIRKLRKLYHAQREFDGVYALCSALVFLKEANEEEQKIRDYLAQGVPPRATRRLVEDQWHLLLDPELRNPVGTLATWLYRSAPDLFTRPARDLGLRRRDQIDVRSSDLYFANMMRYVAKLLNLQSVDLFRKSGSMDSLHLMPAQPPALVAGENNEVFRDASQRVVLFHLGRGLAYSRPELFLARIYPGDELRDLLLGLCLVYNRALQHNGDPREVNRWAQAFEQLPPQALKRLQNPARAAFKELTTGAGLDRYTAAVEITAARAGLTACGDLSASVHGITDGGQGASAMPTRQRIKEIVLFSVSREYLELRKLLGAALVEQNGS